VHYLRFFLEELLKVIIILDFTFKNIEFLQHLFPFSIINRLNLTSCYLQAKNKFILSVNFEIWKNRYLYLSVKVDLVLDFYN
jgi:hypothetical protein